MLLTSASLSANSLTNLWGMTCCVSWLLMRLELRVAETFSHGASTSWKKMQQTAFAQSLLGIQRLLNPSTTSIHRVSRSHIAPIALRSGNRCTRSWESRARTSQDVCVKWQRTCSSSMRRRQCFVSLIVRWVRLSGLTLVCTCKLLCCWPPSAVSARVHRSIGRYSTRRFVSSVVHRTMSCCSAVWQLATQMNLHL